MSPTSTRRRPRSQRAGAAAKNGSRPGGGAPSRARVRRRLVTLLAVIVAGAGIAAAALGPLGDAVREVTLPLRHDDIIRQQARDKGLDPALIAAVIHEESRFQARTSPAGAEGLMQITPETAGFIADRSGATRFELGDLADPQINIAYGSFYLRYLIDRYEGDEPLAIAAYNAGATNVDRWIVAAGGQDEFVVDEHIRFPETLEYVEDVEERRAEYREHYAEELGLN